METNPPTPSRGPIAWIRGHLVHRQHRNSYYLMLNSVAGAATGVLFWLLLTRFAGLPPDQIGVGYAVVALGTIVGLLAKGGLDTALLKSVHGASRDESRRLLGFAVSIAVALALLLSVVFAIASVTTSLVEHYATPGWALVAAIGALLAATWLQDAYFLAEGDARFSLERNLVFSAARLILPLPVVYLAAPHPVALTWAISLWASFLAALFFARKIPKRDGRNVPRKEFLKIAGHNFSGSAAEFLPGLMLAPLVLALHGEAAAAYFGIAWTAATFLFLASAAISRSALAELVRQDPAAQVQSLRRGIRQHLFLLAPAAILGSLVGPELLIVFGADYAREGGLVLAILCLSLVAVGPINLYLAILRAHGRPLPLMLFPAAMIVALVALSPELAERFGLPGVAAAWFLANLPFGTWAVWRLYRLLQPTLQTGPTSAPDDATEARA